MKHTIKTILRNFIKNPVTNLINLTGLAISLALVIMLSVYSFSELSTDNYHKNRDRIFLCDINSGAYTPALLKEQIDLSIPEIESTVRVTQDFGATLPVFQAGNGEPFGTGLIYADPGFFGMFTYEPVEGNLDAALDEPMSMVITKSLSEKLFGNEIAFGKTIKVNNKNELTVTAVIDDSRINSCLTFEAVTSVETKKIINPNGEEFTNWGWGNYQTFMLLNSDADKNKQHNVS